MDFKKSFVQLKWWFSHAKYFFARVILWSFFPKIIDQKSVFSCPSTKWRNIWSSFTLVLYIYNCLPDFKWLALFQFWELMSKNEISRTKSYIYFMKIWVASWFPETGPSLLYIFLFLMVYIMCSRFLPMLMPAGSEDSINLNTLRTFRVLRPLKLVSGVPSEY